MLKIEQLKSYEDLINFAQKHGGGSHEEINGKMTEDEKKLEIAKNLNVPNVEQKADEVLSTINNTNWYDAYGAVNDIKDLTVKYDKVLSLFQEGYEGDELPVSYPIPYDITDYFMRGGTELEDGALPAWSIKTQTDSKNTITQTELELQFSISDKFLAHSTDKKVFDYIQKKLTKAYSRTVASMIINGDSEAGGTGNVNSDDQAPATTFATDGAAKYHATLLDGGIRERAINNSLTVNVGAFDSDDILAVVAKMDERYQDEFDDIALLWNTTTALKAKTDDALKLAANTVSPSIDNGTLSDPWSLKSIVTPLVPKTEADGKVSATPGNNTLGQFLSVYTPAVRWGNGRTFKLEVERVTGKGYRIVATVEIGFTILDSTGTVAAGINVTI